MWEDEYMASGGHLQEVLASTYRKGEQLFESSLGVGLTE